MAVGLPAEAAARAEQVCQLLVAAGYFRARLPALSLFDKIAGGIAWCITFASVDIDVDFHENATIGQKIKIGESIERTLKFMNAPPLQAHQLQGLDLDAIYPVVQWLVKQAYGFRDEISDAMRRLSLTQFELHCASVSLEKKQTDHSLEALRVRYAPARRYRLKYGFSGSVPMTHAKHVLLEYGMEGLRLNELSESRESTRAKLGDGSLAADGRETTDGEWHGKPSEEVGDDNELSQSQISSLVSMGAADIQRAAMEFAQQAEQLISSGAMAGVYKARAEREAIERRLAYERGQLALEMQTTAATRGAVAKMQSTVDDLKDRLAEQREIRRQLLAAADECVGDEEGVRLRELERVVQLSRDITEEAKRRLAEHQEAVQELKEKLRRKMSSPSEVEQKLEEVERLFASELDKSLRMKRLLGQKGRLVAMLQRRLDDVPARAELVQYERRFRELYQQVASTLEETKKYYSLFNCLEERKGFLLKEISLINSIHENFVKVTSGSGREKLVASMEGIITSVQQSLDKVNARLADEMRLRNDLQATYEKLLERERKYYKLVREFQMEALRQEHLSSTQE